MKYGIVGGLKMGDKGKKSKDKISKQKAVEKAKKAPKK